VNPIKRWSMLVVGCGTADLAAVRALGASDLADGLDWAGLVDPSKIRDLNALTCPEYAGHQRKWKVDRLGELVREWFTTRRVATFAQCLEEIDWEQLLEPERKDGVPAGPLVALIGLDDWGSRLRLVESLRHAARRRAGILPVQVALDRDQAQVTVLGNGWDEGCPACGIFPLPGSEPCVLLRDRQLVRGDLQGEARAAAALVIEVVADYLAAGSGSRWIGTKTNLHRAPRGSEQFARDTHPRDHVPGCQGPHGEATPLRPEDLLRACCGEEALC